MGAKSWFELGSWNYFQFGDCGSLATDDRGHNEANEITARTCTGRQAPTWNADGNLTCDGDTTHTVFESSTKLNYTYDYGNRLREVRDETASASTGAEPLASSIRITWAIANASREGGVIG